LAKEKALQVMKKFLFFMMLSLGFASEAQVGINTTTPEGALDVVSSNHGIVLPRVSMAENVTTPSGGDPVNGTMVYDLSRDQVCTRIAGGWLCNDLFGNTEIVGYPGPPSNVNTYIKASNTGAIDSFGTRLTISADGNYLAVAATLEDSNATGVNGDQTNNAASGAGAVYIFQRTSGIWVQEAYLKASNTDANDFFGGSLSFNNDASLLVVGANGEDSNAVGINGDQINNSASRAGAVYVFSRSGTTWTQESYLKASNAEATDLFGSEVSISNDGTRIAVGAEGEDSSAIGVNGNQANNSRSNSGAVYIFRRTGVTWIQEAYIKASNTFNFDSFGVSVSLNSDGSTLAVGADGEDSNATGVNGNQSNNTASGSGAVYIFTRTGVTWSQQAYIKASNTDSGDFFGQNVSLSGNGNTLAVSSEGEASNTTGINGDQTDNSATFAGAAYVFNRTGTNWSQEAYIKASNTEASDSFGRSLSLSIDGNRLIVGAIGEASSATGINGDETDNSAAIAGAVYVFSKLGSSWIQDGYIKASNTDAGDFFGGGRGTTVSGDGTTIVVGASSEESNATGINGDQSNNTLNSAGAVYVIE